MGTHRICRVCLIHGVKMYDCNAYSLKDFYEEIVDEDMTDELPQHFCYECAALLFKFFKFKEKCFLGLKTLRSMLKDGNITPHSISKVDRHKLQSSIGIIQVNKRTKNSRYKHKYTTKKASQDNIKEENNKSDNNKKVNTEISENKAIINEIYEPIDNDNYKINNVDIFNDNNDKLEEITEAIRTNIKIENETINIESDESDSEKIGHKMSTDNIIMIDDYMIKDKIETEKPNIVKLNINSDISDSESENLPLASIQEPKTSMLFDLLQNKPKKVGNKKEKYTKNSNNETGTIKKKNKFKFEYRTQMELNPKHWLKSVLSEEEAIAQFKAKEKDPLYVSRPFKCEFCYKGFKEDGTRERHMKITHCESRGSFVCRFCKSRYKINHYLSKHLQKHFQRIKCLRCEYVCNSHDIATYHDKIHGGATRTCQHCGLQFAHSSTYYTHLRIYHRSEHVCRVCGESFVSQKGLNKHTKIKHFTVDDNISKEESKNCYCETCDIRFETLRAYEEHFKQSAKHTNDNEHLKDKKVITELEKLARVSLKRVKKDKKTCFRCAISFRFYVDFVKHHRSEHKDIPLDNIRNKTKHLLPDVVCEVCGLTMKSANIEHHMNIKHTRHKLMACETCGREFASAHVLKRHQLVHTGERPFKCTSCDKTFKAKSAVKLHYRTFHLKEPYPKRNRKKYTQPE